MYQIEHVDVYFGLNPLSSFGHHKWKTPTCRPIRISNVVQSCATIPHYYSCHSMFPFIWQTNSAIALPRWCQSKALMKEDDDNHLYLDVFEEKYM